LSWRFQQCDSPVQPWVSAVWSDLLTAPAAQEYKLL